MTRSIRPDPEEIDCTPAADEEVFASAKPSPRPRVPDLALEAIDEYEAIRREPWSPRHRTLTAVIREALRECGAILRDGLVYSWNHREGSLIRRSQAPSHVAAAYAGKQPKINTTASDMPHSMSRQRGVAITRRGVRL